jgi:predicted permease
MTSDRIYKIFQDSTGFLAILKILRNPVNPVYYRRRRMQTLWQDLRYGARTLLKNPGFTLIAVLTLALGIGANTAIFSLTDQILLRLLPVERPQELVVLRSPEPKEGRRFDEDAVSYPTYKDLRDRNNAFTGLLAWMAVALSIAGGGQTDFARGELVSGNYFDLLGVRPALGRVFTQEDDRVPGAHPVVVLSHGYWTRRFGADPGILNKTLTLNGASMTVIGVARAGFYGVQVGWNPDVFIPIMMKAQITPFWDGLNERNDHWLTIMGRLKPGLSLAQAKELLQPIYRSILEEELPLIRGWNAEARRKFLDKRLLLDDGAKGRQILQRKAREPLLILMGMVGLVLLIACVNVANLLLARGAARQREIAVRMALGAGRWRLIRQFLVESLLLSLLGGVAGLMVAAWTISGLVAAIPPNIGAEARGLSGELNPRLLVFNLALSVLTGILFGLVPAVRATRLNLEAALREQGPNVSGSRSHARFRKALVIAQIVLTTVLLVGAGLFARSLNNLRRVDLGLRDDHLITFRIAPTLNGYTAQQNFTLFNELRHGLAALPGVLSVSASEIPILFDSWNNASVTIEGYQAQENEDMHIARNWIGPDYFATMGIPLISGREFALSDTTAGPKVAIINETMARRYFANRNPVGSRFGFGWGVRPDIEIVGVVKESKHRTARDQARPFLYIPYVQQADPGAITFYLRTEQDLASITPSLRREVNRRDGNIPIFDLKTLQQQADESMFVDRSLAALSVCFGLLAAGLAAIGLYGVMAYSITRRIREIGIRIALGATQVSVAWLILREVILLALAGLLAGVPLAFALGRAAESLLFEVKASDPLVFFAAILLLGSVVLLGGYLPARRAAKVDPMVALRCE